MKDQPPKIENLQNYESKERKKNIVEIEIEGKKYSLETESYNFEYPKNIQEKTGVLGYERTKISNESIQKICETAGGIDKATLEILRQLSQGEYPDNCITHQIGGYTGSEKRETLTNDLKSDKIFLQKIYGMENIKRELERGTPERKVFSNYEGNGGSANITVHNKKTGGKVHEESFIPIGSLSKYEESLKKNEYYASTTQAGFNFLYKDFWSQQNGGTKLSESVSFGIDLDNNPFWKDYLTKAIEIYSKTSRDRNSYEKASESFDGIHQATAALLLMKYYNNKDNMFNRWEIDELDLSKIRKDFVDSLSESTNKDFFTEKFLTRSLFAKIGNGNEVNLPVFINHDEIPQLCWGHMSFANYYNEQGLNFFKFKHMDHLPTKNNV